MILCLYKFWFLFKKNTNIRFMIFYKTKAKKMTLLPNYIINQFNLFRVRRETNMIVKMRAMRRNMERREMEIRDKDPKRERAMRRKRRMKKMKMMMKAVKRINLLKNKKNDILNWVFFHFIVKKKIDICRKNILKVYWLKVKWLISTVVLI